MVVVLLVHPGDWSRASGEVKSLPTEKAEGAQSEHYLSPDRPPPDIKSEGVEVLLLLRSFPTYVGDPLPEDLVGVLRSTTYSVSYTGGHPRSVLKSFSDSGGKPDLKTLPPNLKGGRRLE